MSDRELMTLAARAMDLELDADFGWHELAYRIPPVEGVLESWKVWRPLHSNDDCAMLEAAFGIGTDWWIEPGAGAAVWCGVVTPENTVFDAVCYFADHGGDRQAARRRASTMVAAAMQKAKEAACN